MQEIVRMLFGSRIYGTNLPTSDHDYKAVFLPSAKEIIMGTVQNTVQQTTKADLTAKSGADDVEVEMMSFKQYLNLLIEGQTVALDMLFTPEEFYISEPHAAWRLIKDNQDKFLHSGVLSFIGYARTQANKYGIKGSRVAASRSATELFAQLILEHGAKTKIREAWPAIAEWAATQTDHVAIVNESMKNQPGVEYKMLEVCNRKVQEGTTLEEGHKVFKRVFDEYGHRALQAETNENVDWKALMHAFRITNQAKELLLTGKVTFPRHDAEFLKEVRTGKVDYKEVATMIENGMQELEKVQLLSYLPKQPDFAFKDQLIFDVYSNIVKSN
jgi:hypothetical protein